jgi:hypothetical protein
LFAIQLRWQADENHGAGIQRFRGRRVLTVNVGEAECLVFYPAGGTTTLLAFSDFGILAGLVYIFNVLGRRRIRL